MVSFGEFFLRVLGWVMGPVAVSMYSVALIGVLIFLLIYLIAECGDYGFEWYHLLVFLIPPAIIALIALIGFSTQFQGDWWIPLHR